jgi:hypothetical protein
MAGRFRVRHKLLRARHFSPSLRPVICFLAIAGIWLKWRFDRLGSRGGQKFFSLLRASHPAA